MKINYNRVAEWLRFDAKNCTLEQLTQLSELLKTATDDAANVDQRREETLRQMQEFARQAGYGSLDELLKPPAAAKARRAKAAGTSRCPFMDPFNPESDCYSLSNRPDKRPHWPAWADDLVRNQKWDKSELHYRQHAKALNARGLPILYNAVERYQRINGI